MSIYHSPYSPLLSKATPNRPDDAKSRGALSANPGRQSRGLAARSAGASEEPTEGTRRINGPHEIQRLGLAGTMSQRGRDMRPERRRLLESFFRERLGPQISALTLHSSRAATSHLDLSPPQREPWHGGQWGLQTSGTGDSEAWTEGDRCLKTTPSDPWDSTAPLLFWSLLVHGVLQARILEWVAFLFSRVSSQPRDRTGVSCIAGGFFTNWAIREAPSSGLLYSENNQHTFCNRYHAANTFQKPRSKIGCL